MKNWRKPSTILRIGDVVIINEDHTFLQQWPMARVVATHPGADGLVRVVTVKTGTSTYKRPVVKLALLYSQEEAAAHYNITQAQAQVQE